MDNLVRPHPTLASLPVSLAGGRHFLDTPALHPLRGSARVRGSLVLLLLPLCLAGGCANPTSWINSIHRDHAGLPQQYNNPMLVPAIDREFLWNQTVDAVDDYFKIEREERIRSIDGILTEGRIDTFPAVGSSFLEPWRKDSTPGYEKWHATLQTIRRKATLRVIPSAEGYLIDVNVLKELEDLDKPEHATSGGSTMRHDGTIVRQIGPSGRNSVSLGWIPLGRDLTLEQRILADIEARLSVVADTSVKPPVELPPTQPEP